MDWQRLHKLAIRSKTSLVLRTDHTVAAEEVVANASAIAAEPKEEDRRPSCSTGMDFAAANRYQITVIKVAYQIVMVATAAVKAFQKEHCYQIAAVAGQVVVDLDRWEDLGASSLDHC